MQPVQAVRGTNDLLPKAAPAWEWLHRVHAETTDAYGYQMVDTPVFEPTELFERGVGTGTDVVEKEMYTFTDRGGRRLSLRPEGTASVLRACLQANLLQQLRPLRVRYAGPMFRYDRPQKGRYRQFFQVGVECLGESSPYLDAEVIEMGWRFLAALGLSGVTLQINSLGDHADRQRYRDALVAYYRPLRDRLCEDCRRRLETNPLRLLDCKRDAELAASAPLITDSLSDGSARFLETVLASLDSAGIPSERNPRLVRGLDYYVHTAFEFWHVSLQGAQNALGGGGRYDGLAEAIGYPSTPGVGYALGVERLLLVASEFGSVPAAPPVCDAVVCSIAEGQALVAAEIARRLRAAGVRTGLDVLDRRLSRKFEYVDRLGASVCVIVGEEEVRDAAVKVRDQRTKVERRVATTSLEETVQRMLRTEAGG